jgi:hypothetical protein
MGTTEAQVARRQAVSQDRQRLLYNPRGPLHFVPKKASKATLVLDVSFLFPFSQVPLS